MRGGVRRRTVDRSSLADGLVCRVGFWDEEDLGNQDGE